MRKIWRIAAAAAVSSLILFTGCKARPVSENQTPEQESAADIQTETITQEEKCEEKGGQAKREQKTQELAEIMAAVERQLGELAFENMPKQEMEQAVSFFEDSYLFAGRTTDSGYSYILGVCTEEENPLEGLTCGNVQGGLGYSVSQFDEGKLLLFEKGGDGYGVSGLYDCLEDGAGGIAYMEDASERGIFLIPPAEGAFLKVSLVRDGKVRTEYVPISEEEKLSLFPGESDGARSEAPKTAEDSSCEGIVLYESRQEMEQNFAGHPVRALTEEAMEFVEKTAGFQPGSLEETEALESAVLTGNFENGTRMEKLGNREDMERLRSLLNEAVPTDFSVNQSFPGKMTLTFLTGEELTVWLSDTDPENGRAELIAGSSSVYEIPHETAESLWRMFGTVDGYRRYADQIWMEMKQDSYTEDDGELAFILHNETGGPIKYALSPVVEKKTIEGGEETWVQMESIAGSCGFLTEMKGEEAELSVPWKGSYKLDGEGTYRLGIQISPEPDLRFAVNAEFELTEKGGGESDE